MDYFGPDQICCCCVPLGCHNERFEYNDQIHSGRLFHRTNFRRHLEKSKNNNNTPSRSTNTNDGPSNLQSSVNTLGSHREHIQSSEKRKDRSDNEDESLDNEDVHRPKKMRISENGFITRPAITLMTFPTESYKIPQKFLQHEMCLESMMNVAYNHIFHKKSNRSCRKSLAFEKNRVKKLMTSANPKSMPFWKEIPATIEDLMKRFHLNITPIETVCCVVCFSLHGNPDSHASADIRCKKQRFPSDSSQAARITCNARLFKQKKSRSGHCKVIPRSIFYHQKLLEWLGRMCFIPAFEKALDSPLNAKSPPKGVMHDIWDSKLWKTFKSDGRNYTQASGNLVFGLYVDWFNPYGNGSAKKYSAGVILLICFSLPPNIRYHAENVFIYGITPGPREPGSQAMNHLLGPLIAELDNLWKGVRFTKTSQYPHGRVFRVALWPLIADVPANRKISGFAGHSATYFCSNCYITCQDVNNIEVDSYKIRHITSIHQQSQLWRSAETQHERKQLLKTNGVRYTILSELKYWHPINHGSIDTMHCLLLGLLKDFSTTYLQIPSAGKILRKELDKAELEGIYPEDQPPVHPHLAPGTNALIRNPNDDSSEQSSDSRMSYPRAAKSQTSTQSTLSEPNTSNRSDASDSSASTILGAHGPALTPHELKLIHKSIEQAITPSWLPAVPPLFGTTAHGSVKAVQWLVLYTVYMVFSLIPYLSNAEPNSDSQKIHTAILLATQIINLSVSRVMSENDIQSLGLILKNYRQHLQTVWPNIKSKPNLHFAQHLPDQCRRLGPPPYTAAWVGERVIGTLVQTPKNFCAGIVLVLLG